MTDFDTAFENIPVVYEVFIGDVIEMHHNFNLFSNCYTPYNNIEEFQGNPSYKYISSRIFRRI